AVRRNLIGNGTPDVRPHVSREFADYRRPVSNVHEESALDCSEERNAIESGIAFEIRNAVVQKTSRTPENDGRLENPAATPLVEPRLTRAAADAEHCTSLGGHPHIVWPNREYVHSQCREVVFDGGVFRQQQARCNGTVILRKLGGADAKAVQLA